MREGALVINGRGVGQKWPLVKLNTQVFLSCKSIGQTTVNQNGMGSKFYDQYAAAKFVRLNAYASP